MVTKPSARRANKNLEREILKMEDQLGKALTTRDTVSLDRILADSYADSLEGSDRAISKRGTIARCRNGVVPYYSIDGERTISVRVNMVVVEGVSSIGPDDEKLDDIKNEERTRVKRYWTKKDGRWRLTAQTRLPIDVKVDKQKQTDERPSYTRMVDPKPRSLWRKWDFQSR